MLSIKQGDTFAFKAEMKNEDETPMTGIAYKLKSQIRDIKNTLYAELQITETDDIGTYIFKADAEITKSWPVTKLYCDIQYKDADVVSSSETIEIMVERDVTKDE
ncbi:hypothetical protein J2Z35_002519 [Acetoanaerobium pronyense]|uniref:BppU N-terminal domain-containing protein n=1 Tax=Acetoanaerobium pronyense TaxID=1482736 RepID=A0ABS4KLP2_9FIRM|nr:hypothetical protein [Acetoanaerobium pronyense]MBP2028689.1 hypothetical protein [Acetoanaerobium pronyense]